MARIRSVHPDLCASETMAQLPAEVERTFVRLWTHCDDDGRAVDNAKLIKAALFPLHDDVTAETVDRHLDVLADAGLIVRYEAGGKRYLAVRSWYEFQKPQKKRASTLPAPSDTPPVAVPDASRTPTVVVREGYGPGEGVGEGVGVGEGDGNSAPEPARETPSGALVLIEPDTPHPRRPNYDPLWEAVMDACAIDTTTITGSSRGAYNRALAELRGVGATPDDVHVRARVYRVRWPDASLTPSALARRWAECAPDPRHLPAPKVNATDVALARVLAAGDDQ